MAKIGICDWGIGGLGVYKALRDQLQCTADIVYFSDAGFTPYGKVPKEELFKRWLKVKEFFRQQNVDLIIVACNALSTVVDEDANTITIAGAVKKLVQKNRDIPLGIIGGIRTIESGIYDLGYVSHEGRIAQPLSALVEKGVISGNQVEEEIRKVLEPMKMVRKVILACTHYPVLAPVFSKLYPEIEFIDPVNELIKAIPVNLHGNAHSSFYTSGNIEQMQNIGLKAFDVQMDSVEPALLILE